MKKKRFLAGAAVLFAAAVMCLAGCPTGQDEESGTSSKIRGFVGFDEDVIDELDFTLVTVQLLKEGKPAGNPVKPAKNGVFEFDNVENGAGYTVLALADSPLYSNAYGLAGVSPGFAVTASTPLIEVLMQPAAPRSVSGVVKGAEEANGRQVVSPNDGANTMREDADVGRTKVQLWRGNVLVQTIKAGAGTFISAEGKYVAPYQFDNVPQGYGYTVKAELESAKFPGRLIYTWESDEFAVLYIGGGKADYETVIFTSNEGTFEGDLVKLPVYDIKGTMTAGGGPVSGATVVFLLDGRPLARNVGATTDAAGEFAIEFVPGGGGYQLRVSAPNAGDPGNLYYWLSEVFTVDETNTALPTGADRSVYTIAGELQASQVKIEQAQFNIGLKRLELTFSLPVTIPASGDFTLAAAAPTTVTAAVNAAGNQTANTVWYLTLSRDVAKDASLTLSGVAGAAVFTGGSVIGLPAVTARDVPRYEAEPFEVVKVFSRLGYAQCYVDLGIAPASFPGFAMASGAAIPTGLHLYAWNRELDDWDELTISGISAQTAANSGATSQQTGAVNGAYRIARSGSGYDWAQFRLVYDSTAGGGYRRTTDGALLKSFDLVSINYWHTPWN